MWGLFNYYFRLKKSQTCHSYNCSRGFCHRVTSLSPHLPVLWLSHPLYITLPVLLLCGTRWWRMCVICNLPVAGPCTLVCGGTKRGAIRKHRHALSTRSSIGKRLSELLQQKLFAKVPPCHRLTGSPSLSPAEGNGTWISGKQQLVKTAKKPNETKPISFREGRANTLLSNNKWLWYGMFAMLRSLKAQHSENTYSGCIKSENLRTLPVSPVQIPVDYLCCREYSFYFPPANWSCTHLCLMYELSNQICSLFFRSKGCSAETRSSSS